MDVNYAFLNLTNPMAGVRIIQTSFACCRYTAGMLQVNFFGINQKNLDVKSPALYFGTRYNKKIFFG